MISHKWLNITEAAVYLRATEAFLQEELKKGWLQYSEFGGQMLFNTDQLDKFLFSMQVELFHEKDTMKSVHNIEPMPSLSDPLTIEDHIDDSRTHQELVDSQDFMQQACRLWDDGEKFTAHFRTKGASCQFRGEPRLWIFERKFHVPGKDKGNDLHEQIRKVLTKYFPQVTGKATFHINKSGFSWLKFENFVRDVKEISKKALAEELTTVPSHSEVPQERDPVGLYEKCIRLWEEPPDFTIVYGTRGCSARNKNRSRLWFFPNYIRIPTDSQNNSLFEEIVTLKEDCFPYLKTKTKISFDTPGIGWPEIEAFIKKVKIRP